MPKKTCMMLNINFNYDWFIGEGANCITPSQSFLMDENAFVIPFQQAFTRRCSHYVHATQASFGLLHV